MPSGTAISALQVYKKSENQSINSFCKARNSTSFLWQKHLLSTWFEVEKKTCENHVIILLIHDLFITPICTCVRSAEHTPFVNAIHFSFVLSLNCVFQSKIQNWIRQIKSMKQTICPAKPPRWKNDFKTRRQLKFVDISLLPGNEKHWLVKLQIWYYNTKRLTYISDFAKQIIRLYRMFGGFSGTAL